MSLQLELVRKPPIGISRSERLKITLDGNHTIKQKIAMLLQAKFDLHEGFGIDFAGPTDVYFSLIDLNGYPLTHFPDGRLISEYNGIIKSPYHCAADQYHP